jgi:hypothetical protein
LEVERCVLRHPALFREIFRERSVNNIYFDTLQRSHFWDSVFGAAERLKVRIRWYGELFGLIAGPMLELKQKYGLVGRKESYPLQAFVLQPGTDLAVLRDVIRQTVLPDAHTEELLSLSPVLLNRYRRKYFLSADSRFRITIDDDLQCFRLSPRKNTFLDKCVDRRHVIVELKYDHDCGDAADRITSRFPFRMTRWSKYVNGLGGDYFH